MRDLDDKELEQCINYSSARSGAYIKHINHPEIDCKKCEDAYDVSCPRYSSKFQFLQGQLDLRNMFRD